MEEENSRLAEITKRTLKALDSKPMHIPKTRREAYRLCSYLTQALNNSSDDITYRAFLRPIRPKNDPTRVGFIYLMRNNRNGYTKIGFSSEPHYRERTLQAEDPDTVMVFHTPGTMEREKQLHGDYAAFSVRGEWFDLTPGQCAEIQNKLK